MQQHAQNSIHGVLLQASRKLRQTSPTPRLDAEVLLAYVLKKHRNHLYTWPEKQLESSQIHQIRDLIKKRLQGYPVAYLKGHREFWSLDIEVNPSVLIPRPETELLVKLALDGIPNSEIWSIADLGTGSGVIAIALAKERPRCIIHACDNCPLALATAKKNADTHAASNISFYLSDWFSSLPDQQYHLIVSNPPYVSDHDPHLQRGDLRFEPITALRAGIDGLNALQTIGEQATQRLIKNGHLILEHGYDQARSVATILTQCGYSNLSAHRDLSGHLRATVAQWKAGQ